MGIYFRDILLIRISRGADNCGQHSLEKNIYFIMRFSPHFQLFYFNDRLEFCEFFEWKIKRMNNADLFSQPPLLIFIKGANISGGHFIYIYIYIYIYIEREEREGERERERERECQFIRKCWFCSLWLVGWKRCLFANVLYDISILHIS